MRLPYQQNSAVLITAPCWEGSLPGRIREKDIYVFNSRSASEGETLIAMKIQECEEKGMGFKEVVDTVEAYIQEQDTYFVLEDAGHSAEERQTDRR